MMHVIHATASTLATYQHANGFLVLALA